MDELVWCFEGKTSVQEVWWPSSFHVKKMNTENQYGMKSDVIRERMALMKTAINGDYIVLPMLGSTVRKMLTQFGVEMFDEEDACSVSKQVAEGLSYLHHMGITHTDITSENVLLSVDSVGKLRDVRRRSSGKKDAGDVLVYIVDMSDARIGISGQSGMIGSNQYRAPEVTLGLPWNNHVDSFALGCLMYEIRTGGMLFPWTTSSAERLFAVFKRIGPFPSDLVRNAGPAFEKYFRDIGGVFEVLLSRTSVSDIQGQRHVRALQSIQTDGDDGMYAKWCRSFLVIAPDKRGRLEEFLMVMKDV
ncbi:kinase-like domain-containing protein [Earliella scabrosa]|nr:kinase-like domain-containing protein [Earliella scabrosa]